MTELGLIRSSLRIAHISHSECCFMSQVHSSANRVMSDIEWGKHLKILQGLHGVPKMAGDTCGYWASYGASLFLSESLVQIEPHLIPEIPVK